MIKDYIFGLKTEIGETVDWRIIFDYSCSHQLVPIIYHQSKSFITADLLDDFKSSSFATIYSNIKRKELTDRVINSLIESGIKCFFN